MLIAARWTRTLALLGVAMASAASAQDYAIRLSRPNRVGQKLHISALGGQGETSILRIGDRPPRKSVRGFQVELDTFVTVLAIDPKGEPSEVSCAIEKCVLIRGKRREELFPKGTVVSASVRDKREVFEVDGEAVAPQAAQALRLILSLAKGTASDDEVFGARERKRVGQSWPINAAVAARDLAKVGVRCRKEDVAGKVALLGVAEVEGIPCLRIRATMDFRKVAPPLPRGLEVQAGRCQVRLSGAFPVDTSKPGPLESRMGMVMSFRAKGRPNPKGPPIEIVSTTKRSVTRRFTFYD